MKIKRNGGFTLIELLVVITIIAILASFAVPVFTKVIANAQQSKQINNCKQILTGCALFAADKGGGVYPSGLLDEEGNFDSEASVTTDAELAFNDLFKAGIIDLEALFYNNKNTVKCGLVPPDEDGELEAAENCWDIVTGMNNTVGNLPLIAEASDGDGATWTLGGGGHPWIGSVVVGMADGSSTKKESLSSAGEAKVNRKSGQGVALMTVGTAEDGWPSTAENAYAGDGGGGG